MDRPNIPLPVVNGNYLKPRRLTLSNLPFAPEDYPQIEGQNEEPKECPVCYDDTDDMLDCGHPLCTRCAQQLLNPICPCCRADIDMDRYSNQVKESMIQNLNRNQENAELVRTMVTLMIHHVEQAADRQFRDLGVDDNIIENLTDAFMATNNNSNLISDLFLIQAQDLVNSGQITTDNVQDLMGPYSGDDRYTRDIAEDILKQLMDKAIENLADKLVDIYLQSIDPITKFPTDKELRAYQIYNTISMSLEVTTKIRGIEIANQVRRIVSSSLSQLRRRLTEFMIRDMNEGDYAYIGEMVNRGFLQEAEQLLEEADTRMGINADTRLASIVEDQVQVALSELRQL